VKMDLAQAVDLYLETRHRFGFALTQVGVELRSLVRYAQQINHTGPLTTALAMQWAGQPGRCAPAYRALRLDIARRLAEFWLAYEPGIQVPPRGCFGPLYRRRTVHIYSREEVRALLEAASDLGRVQPLRAASFRTVIGLLDCTGLRIGEALGLTDGDINWSAGVLTIRRAKNGRIRLIPVQSSTLEAGPVSRPIHPPTLATASPPQLSPRLANNPAPGHSGPSRVRGPQPPPNRAATSAIFDSILTLLRS